MIIFNHNGQGVYNRTNIRVYVFTHGGGDGVDWCGLVSRKASLLRHELLILSLRRENEAILRREGCLRENFQTKVFRHE